MLPETLVRFRNRLLADPRFHQLVQRFALTRLIARRRSVQLFDLLAGFSYSQVLFACVEMRVFTKVGLAGCSTDELVAHTGLSPERCTMLVKAAAALGLLERSGSRIHLGEQGAVLLAQPWIVHFVEHHRHFYRDLENPADMLKGARVPGGLRDFWTYDEAGTNKELYSALMASSQVAVSEQILAAYDFGRHKRLLDVGGGTGAFARAVGRHHPNLDLNVFDLPGVSETAEEPLVRHHHGDFRHDPLPRGMDVISIVRVVHDHDDEAVLALLRNVRAACEPQTTVLIAEPFAGNRSTRRVTDAYFNFYFAAMGQGRTRSPRDIAALASQAGFGQMKQWPTRMPLISGILSLTPDKDKRK